MKGYPYRQPRCRVCGSPAYAGTQTRPLCIHCEATEKEIHELLAAPAQKMHEQAEELRKEADNLDRFAMAGIVFMAPCPDGLATDCHSQVCDCHRNAQERALESLQECACVLPEQSCPLCEKRAGEVYA